MEKSTTFRYDLSEIRFEIIVAMLSEDPKLYALLKEFVEEYEKVKETMETFT